MDDNALEALQARVARLEDEAAITRLIMSYGPAADAGLNVLWQRRDVHFRIPVLQHVLD